MTAAGTSSPAAKLAESVATGLAGAVLGGLCGGLVHPLVGWIAAAVAAVNGLVSGWRQVYWWQHSDGWVAFFLDSTWASLPVLLAQITHVVARLSPRGAFEPVLSRRQNRHVYRGGFRLKPTYAFTMGNVISNARNVDDSRRRRLITDHESVHVWQARWFGPMYVGVYVLWFAGGAVAGVLLWLRRGRRDKLTRVIESCGYYTNPFEWWAYSRDDNWPPSGKVAGIGWKRAAVRPLAQARAERRQHR